jgi:hypothetical protein
VIAPAVPGVNATVHDELNALVEESAQLPPLLSVTVPLGALGFAPVSLTVTAQSVATPTWTEAGEQATVVLVGSAGRAFTVRAAVAVLAAKPVLPTKEAVTVWLPD